VGVFRGWVQRGRSVLLLSAGAFYFGAVGLAAQSPNDGADWQNRASSRFPTDGWERYVDAADAGFSAERLERARRYWQKRGSPALMVLSGGVAVAAWGDVDRRLPIHSIRKSLLSALYGVYGGSVDIGLTLGALGIDEITPLTPEESGARVSDLLASRSGVYLPAAGEAAETGATRPERGSHAPGTLWWYNNWDFNAAGTVFETLTGMSVLKAFELSIADPVGMQDWRLSDGFYNYEPEMSLHRSFGANMSTRDLARFGLLLASGGRWGDEQIIPEEWVEVSTRAHSKIDLGPEYGTGYGYMWWVNGSEGFSARGYGGHVLAVYPDEDLVIVVRADTYHDRFLSNRAVGILLDRIRAAKVRERVHSPRLESLSGPGPGVEEAERLPDEELARYAGEFDLAGGGSVVVAASRGHLTLDYGRGVFGLVPVGSGRFITEDTRDAVVFALASDGRTMQVLSEPILYLEAAAAAGRGDVDGAVGWVKKAVETFPESPDVRFNLARALMGSGDRTAAAAQLDTALSLDPNHPNALRLRNSLGLRRVVPGAVGVLLLVLVLSWRLRRSRRMKGRQEDSDVTP